MRFQEDIELYFILFFEMVLKLKLGKDPELFIFRPYAHRRVFVQSICSVGWSMYIMKLLSL